MRLPTGRNIQPFARLENQTLFQLLRALAVSGFRGSITQRTEDGLNVVLLEGGRPVCAVVHREGALGLTGEPAARHFADTLDADGLKIVELDPEAFALARTICRGECYASGLPPHSEAMNRFYARCSSEGLDGLIQLYDDNRQYFIPIERGKLARRPSGEDYDTFRVRSDYRVDLYLSPNGAEAQQQLRPSHFIPPFWLRNYLCRQLKRNFLNKADRLVEELKEGEVGFEELERWQKRIEEYLENFVCSPKKAKGFVEKLRALLEETEEYRHLAAGDKEE